MGHSGEQFADGQCPDEGRDDGGQAAVGGHRGNGPAGVGAGQGGGAAGATPDARVRALRGEAAWAATAAAFRVRDRLRPATESAQCQRQYAKAAPRRVLRTFLSPHP